MTLQIALTPEMEAKLRARAAEAGKDPASFVHDVIANELESDAMLEGSEQTHNLTTEEWIRRLREWAASHPSLPYEIDDSRESNYEGRGE